MRRTNYRANTREFLNELSQAFVSILAQKPITFAPRFDI